MTISRLDNFLLFPYVWDWKLLFPPLFAYLLTLSHVLAFIPAFPNGPLRGWNRRVRTAKKRERKRERFSNHVFLAARNRDRLQIGRESNEFKTKMLEGINGDVTVYRQTRLEWRTKIEVWSSQTPMKRRHETLRSFDQGGRIGRVSNDNYIITVCMRERERNRDRDKRDGTGNYSVLNGYTYIHMHIQIYIYYI